MFDVTPFRTISMRGRVAYGLLCLEDAILALAQSHSKWTWLLCRLWEYTSTEDLDEWQERIAEMIPRVVLDSSSYDDGGFESLAQDEFAELRALYEDSNPVLVRLVDLVFDVGTLEMFGGIEHGAPVSLENLGAVAALMAEQSLVMPDSSALADISFAECQGWGTPFQGKLYSRLVRSV